MIREKRTISGAVWMVSILAALMFGALLGSPLAEDWTGRILHNISLEKLAFKEAASKPAIDTAASSPAVNAEASGPAANATVSGPAIEVLASEPAVEVGANRGASAGRKEKDVLIRLINAEAYGLSYKAKLAVGQVVMNRWAGPYYGDDLMAIMTAPHQFTPIYDGSAYKKEIEPDSAKAANAVLSGASVQELTEDTYYFVNPDFTEDKTIENNMEFVCEIEGIHFYRPPDK